jgi:hypothetical protein
MTASTTTVPETQTKKMTASAQAATHMFAVEVSVMALVDVAVAGFL